MPPACWCRASAAARGLGGRAADPNARREGETASASRPRRLARALRRPHPVALAQPLEGRLEAVGILDSGGDPAVAADVLGLRDERKRQRDLALLLRQLE